jgi:hypothetical protein
MVLSVESIPFGVLISLVFPHWPDAALACPLRRRSRFWLRFAGVVIAMLLPDLVAILAPLGEQIAGPLVLLGFVWGFCFSCRRGLCSLADRVPTRDRARKMVRDRVPGTVGPRHRRRSAGSRSLTHNRHRRGSATIARGVPRVLVARFASGSAFRHGCGRYGCGRRGVTSECAHLTPARVPGSS